MHQQLFLQQAGLCIRPVQNGMIAVGSSFPDSRSDLSRHIIRLMEACIKFPYMDRGSGRILGPQRLFLPRTVVGDHMIGRFKNGAGGPVILFKAYDLGLRPDLFKVKDIADVGSAEAVDRLIVISDDAQISSLSRQLADQHKLRRVGVLILIHHDKTETVAVHFQNVLVFIKQLHGQHQHVVEVDGIALFQFPLISAVDRSDLCFKEISCRLSLELVRADQLVLRGGDRIHDLFFLKHLCVYVHLFAQLFDQRFLIIGIVDREMSVISKSVDMSAQYTPAGAVERGDPDAFRSEAHQIVYPLPHLIGRLVRESDRQYVPWTDILFIDQPGDPVSEHSRLSRPGSCQDQQRSFIMFHRFLLLRV